MVIICDNESYQNATKMSVKVSMAEKAAKTIQYIIHLTWNRENIYHTVKLTVSAYALQSIACSQLLPNVSAF